MEPRNRYGHSFVLAFSAPSVPQDFRFNEHTHIHPHTHTHTTGRERGEIDTKRKRVKRERDKVRERAMREHIYVYNERCRENERERETPTRERNARQYVTDGRMQFTTFYERSLSVFPPPGQRSAMVRVLVSESRTEMREKEREGYNRK